MAKSAGAAACFALLMAASSLTARAEDGQLRRFFRELGSREALFQAGAWALSAAAVAPADDAVSEWMIDEEPLGPNARDIGYWMSHRYVVAGSIVAFAGSGWALGNDGLVETSLVLLESQLFSAAVTEGLKHMTNRERPDGSNELSFPSGHATAAWCSALVVQGRFGWKWGIPVMLAAAYVGGSRIQDGKHYPSDILMGFAVGHWAARAALRSASEDGPSDPPLGAVIQFGRVTRIPLLSFRF